MCFRIIFSDGLDDVSPSDASHETLFEAYASTLTVFPDLDESDVPGRIGSPEFFPFWRDVLEADDEILSIIKHGYKVPFIGDTPPPPSHLDNNKSALAHPDFLISELLRLEKIGAIKRVDSRPRITLPCSVVFSNKLRLVVDAKRQVNPHVVKNKVSLDSLSSAEQVSQRGDFMSKQDLTSGYFHVPLHPNSQQNFGVSYTHPDGTTWFWIWLCLFLGEKNAVFLFTKLLKPHRRFLSRQGIRNALMIDDFLLLSKNFLKALMDLQIHLEALALAGWVVKPSKCQNHPVQRIEFLGLIKDSVLEAYFIPEKKKLRIYSEIERVLEADFLPVRVLAGLYGLLISIYKVVGPVIRLLSRFGFECINSCSSWNQLVFISAKCKQELFHIYHNLNDLEGYRYESLGRPLVVHSRTFASDASNKGLAVISLDCDQLELVEHRIFTPVEMVSSSTYRELLAFHQLYTTKAHLFAGHHILHQTDSHNVSRLFQIGSKRSHLHSLLFDVFMALHAHKVRLTVEWLPRTDPTIEVADYFSRTMDATDYGIGSEAFQSISHTWGPFSIDLFAND